MANGTNGDGWPYTPGSTPPPSDEMKDLAARMAADEANEGNYAAAAELQEVAKRSGLQCIAPIGEQPIPVSVDEAELQRIQEEEHAGYDRHTGEADDPTAALRKRVIGTAGEAGGVGEVRLHGHVKVPMSEVPGHSYVAPDHCAWTDPMCPDPMEKSSMYCRPHQIAARKSILRNVLTRFFTLVADPVENDLVGQRVDLAMEMIQLAAEHSLPGHLGRVTAIALEQVRRDRTYPQVKPVDSSFFTAEEADRG